ncbi:hypothetical protein QR680_018383 [Steinernema hermaphroditum]|uniref:Uncharacterized protein n=1 Tax=Steinernema hermaphroditum TaxID=289476 RepID=A0AA39HIQ2_9BILA|nr:hypothetical protein QR680_018383 [Steinernema hermaphroditum]
MSRRRELKRNPETPEADPLPIGPLRRPDPRRVGLHWSSYGNTTGYEPLDGTVCEWISDDTPLYEERPKNEWVMDWTGTTITIDEREESSPKELAAPVPTSAQSGRGGCGRGGFPRQHYYNTLAGRDADHYIGPFHEAPAHVRFAQRTWSLQGDNTERSTESRYHHRDAQARTHEHRSRGGARAHSGFMHCEEPRPAFHLRSMPSPISESPNDSAAVIEQRVLQTFGNHATDHDGNTTFAVDVVEENVEQGGAALEEEGLVEREWEPIAPAEMEMATKDESSIKRAVDIVEENVELGHAALEEREWEPIASAEMEMATSDESNIQCAVDVVEENVEQGGAALEEEGLVEREWEPIAPAEMEISTKDESSIKRAVDIVEENVELGHAALEEKEGLVEREWEPIAPAEMEMATKDESSIQRAVDIVEENVELGHAALEEKEGLVEREWEPIAPAEMEMATKDESSIQRAVDIVEENVELGHTALEEKEGLVEREWELSAHAEMEIPTEDEGNIKCAIDVVQENLEHGDVALEEQELVEHDMEPIAPAEMEMTTKDENSMNS